MESEPANQAIVGSQEGHDEVPNLSSEPLRETIENFDVEDDFFEIQTLINNEMIRLVELKDMELSKEKQELTDKLLERTKMMDNLVAISKSEQKAKTHQKKDKTLIIANKCCHYPGCSFKTKWECRLKIHINAVHRKLKDWKCSDCTKSKRIKTYHLKYFI